MLKVKFGKKEFKFRSSFEEFDLVVIHEYMTAMDQYDSYIKKYEDNALLIASLPSDRVGRIGELIAEGDAITMQIHSSKIKILHSLCISAGFSYFATSTKGVDYDIIHDAAQALINKLGHFDVYWNTCPTIQSFTHKPKKKLFKKNYCIHEMEGNTIVRTEMAAKQLKQAFEHKKQLDSGKWDRISEFCAVIARPLLQKDEIAKANSFVTFEELKGMNHSDRLAYYSDKLMKAKTKLTVDFKNLSLPIAIGLIKEFWKKKTT